LLERVVRVELFDGQNYKISEIKKAVKQKTLFPSVLLSLPNCDVEARK